MISVQVFVYLFAQVVWGAVAPRFRLHITDDAPEETAANVESVCKIDLIVVFSVRFCQTNMHGDLHAEVVHQQVSIYFLNDALFLPCMQMCQAQIVF